MKKDKQTKMPKKIFVYVFDFDDKGDPLYSVATSIEEISESELENNRKVGIYILSEVSTLVVRRKLK